MGYRAPRVGHELSSVMYGIKAEVLADAKGIKEELIRALERDGFTILGVTAHAFEPQGFTIAVLLAESHAAVHTYPEYGSLYFSIYSCRGEGDGERVYEHMKEYLNPAKVEKTSQAVVVGEGTGM